MPSDDWAKLKNKRKAAGRTREGQNNYDAGRNKSVDAWIAWKEEQIRLGKAKGAKKKKQRKAKRKQSS